MAQDKKPPSSKGFKKVMMKRKEIAMKRWKTLRKVAVMMRKKRKRKMGSYLH